VNLQYEEAVARAMQKKAPSSSSSAAAAAGGGTPPAAAAGVTPPAAAAASETLHIGAKKSTTRRAKNASDSQGTQFTCFTGTKVQILMQKGGLVTMTLTIEYKGACDGVGRPVVVDGLARGAPSPAAGAAAENKSISSLAPEKKKELQEPVLAK